MKKLFLLLGFILLAGCYEPVVYEPVRKHRYWDRGNIPTIYYRHSYKNHRRGYERKRNRRECHINRPTTSDCHQLGYYGRHCPKRVRYCYR